LARVLLVVLDELAVKTGGCLLGTTLLEDLHVGFLTLAGVQVHFSAVRDEVQSVHVEACVYILSLIFDIGHVLSQP
jgi:hypothetical protein